MDTPIITREDIETLGIILPEDEVENFLQHTNDTLSERVGAEITEGLSDEEVDEMLNIEEGENAEALQAWLIEHVPELKDIVQDEKDILLGELAASGNK